MSKTTVSSAASAVAEPEISKADRSGYTNWDAFEKANVAVKSIMCSPLPGRPADEACKTKLIPSAKNVIAHVNAGHGGGFVFTLAESRTPWPGWKEFKEAKLEIQSLRDEVNDHYIPLSIRGLRALFKPHQGKFRGAYQAFQNQILLNLAFTAPPASGDDYLDDEPQNFE